MATIHTYTHTHMQRARECRRRLQMHFLYVVYRQMSDVDDDVVAGGDTDKPRVSKRGRERERGRQAGREGVSWLPLLATCHLQRQVAK